MHGRALVRRSALWRLPRRRSDRAGHAGAGDRIRRLRSSADAAAECCCHRRAARRISFGSEVLRRCGRREATAASVHRVSVPGVEASDRLSRSATIALAAAMSRRSMSGAPECTRRASGLAITRRTACHAGSVSPRRRTAAQRRESSARLTRRRLTLAFGSTFGQTEPAGCRHSGPIIGSGLRGFTPNNNESRLEFASCDASVTSLFAWRCRSLRWSFPRRVPRPSRRGLSG
jgi:hypothetical protein